MTNRTLSVVSVALALAAGLAACGGTAPAPTIPAQIASSSTPSPRPTHVPITFRTEIPIPIDNTPTPSGLTIDASVTQLDEALRETFPYFYGLDLDVELSPEDINGDGFPDQVARYRTGDVYLALIRTDISGDGENDLIVQSSGGVFIFVTLKGILKEPIGVQSRWSRGSGPEIHLRLVDYTGDDVPEAVIDDAVWGGGTGLWIYHKRETIVHCASNQCSVVWQDTVDEEIQDYNWGGYLQERATVSPETGAEGSAMLRVLREGFSIYCCEDPETGTRPPPTLEISPSKLSILKWSGTQFDLVGEETVSLGRTIQSTGPIVATSSTGDIAGISWENNKAAGNMNEYCRAYVGSAWIGDYFGCRHLFTCVSWEDVTGDQAEEIVIQTYSAGDPYGPEDLLSNDSCMHQRLIVYQRSPSGFVEIANVAGCVVRNDLFGVAMRDENGDGIPEIIAAPLVTELDVQSAREYRWNGESFTLWSALPHPDPDDYHWVP